MRIAFVSQVNAYDRSALSGSAYQVLQTVLATGATVEVVSPLMENWRLQTMRLASIPSRLTGHGMAWPKHPYLLQHYAKKVDAAVERIKPDLVFSPGTNVIAYSKFKKPTVFWSDAPFGAMMDYYPWAQYQRLTARSRQYGLDADTRALRYSVAGIYRSNWAREIAIEKHQADPSRVHVLPLPGNLFRKWSLDEVRVAEGRRLQTPWKILFNGVDWQRKGGDRAVAIINEMVRKGQPCELKVVGTAAPPRAVSAARFPVASFGKLNLNDPVARAQLATIMDESTFLLVPSTAETFGFVYCEAMSAGVPSVGTATGGVSDVIVDGETGLLVDINEPSVVTADRMLELARPEHYRKMTEAGWHRWQSRFALNVVLAQLQQILEKALSLTPVATP